MTSSKTSSLADIEKRQSEAGVQPVTLEDPDAEFGGPEARRRLERKLLRKIDLRMSVMIVIYILNYVRALQQLWVCAFTEKLSRLTVTMPGTLLV